MAKERILIAVKTYPVLSREYTELACTAGFREDGSWVRIYPIPFRLLDATSQFKKYQWIELDLEKRSKDSRPESYNPKDRDDIKLLESIGTERNWAERKRIILEKNTIHTNLTALIAQAHQDTLSLAIFKPTEILDVIVKATDREWDKSKLEDVKHHLQQGKLFDDTANEGFKITRKLPYKFSYRFKDDEGKESTMMIEDWEIGALFWNCVKKHDEKTACEMIKQKYFDDMAKTKDLYLFLGTTFKFHLMKSPNPFLVIGTFYPPKETQSSFL